MTGWSLGVSIAIALAMFSAMPRCQLSNRLGKTLSAPRLQANLRIARQIGACSTQRSNIYSVAPRARITSAIAEEHLDLEDGFKMHVLHQSMADQSNRPPIVFVHGSFHSAWCWAQHWMPYFAEHGYESYAVSLRGTSKSPDPLVNNQSVPNVEQHVIDLLRFMRLKGLSGNRGRPILVAHSFGGMVVMKTIQDNTKIAKGVALLCSVPPSGNGPMVKRFVASRGFDTTVKITKGFVLKEAAKDLGLCRKFFFSEDLPETDVSRYMARFNEDSKSFIDVTSVDRRLPSFSANSAGVAKWMNKGTKLETMVLGARADYLVDAEGVKETAQFLATKPTFVEGAHDVMLDVGQGVTAETLLKWADKIT